MNFVQYSPSFEEFDENNSMSTDATVCSVRQPRFAHKRNRSESSLSASKILNGIKESMTFSPPSTPQRKYPQVEKRILQAHDITRAIFACSSPCQVAETGASGKCVTPRPGTGSFYLPSDLMDDEDVYEYCGVEADILEHGPSGEKRLQQNYSMSRV